MRYHHAAISEEEIKIIYDAIRQLMKPPETKKKKIGFIVKEGSVLYRAPNRKAAER